MIAWRTDVKWRQWHFAFLFHNQQIDSMLPSDHHAKASKCGKDISNRLMWLFRSCHILTSSMPDQLLNRRTATWNLFVKAAKYEIQKPSTCRAALFRCRFWVDALRLLHCVINLSRNGYICRGLEKIVAISRARVYFEQQILALVFVFHQTRNLLGSTASKSTNQCVAFLQPATIVFVARQVDLARWKTRNIDPKLATEQCSAGSWGLLNLVFRRL